MKLKNAISCRQFIIGLQFCRQIVVLGLGIFLAFMRLFSSKNICVPQFVGLIKASVIV